MAACVVDGTVSLRTRASDRLPAAAAAAEARDKLGLDLVGAENSHAIEFVRNTAQLHHSLPVLDLGVVSGIQHMSEGL